MDRLLSLPSGRAASKAEFYDPMVKEYLHHFMLKALFNNKQSASVSFLGGTALRYFYDLKRFSEDLDFDCTDLSRAQFLEITDNVCKELQDSGFNVVLEDKKKHETLNAFRRVFVFPELKYQLGISQQRETKFFIKIAAEPQNYSYITDIKTLNGFGITTPVRIVPKQILFASKISAALKRRKDRDFFDVVSLIDFVKPDFGYLKIKCKIENPDQLKSALENASIERNLVDRKTFDCEHMLFNRNDVEKIRSFRDYINSFNFKRLE